MSMILTGMYINDDENMCIIANDGLSSVIALFLDSVGLTYENV